MDFHQVKASYTMVKGYKVFAYECRSHFEDLNFFLSKLCNYRHCIVSGKQTATIMGNRAIKQGLR